jgi:glycosyltransferase involved in cell wall biosynthesis
MNVLFALYGDLGGNSAVPMMLHAGELDRRGHRCAVTLGAPDVATADGSGLRVVSHAEAIAAPGSVFPDGRPADLVHAWTPREGVRRFVTEYLTRSPAAFLVYLEDNEAWIARAALAKVGIAEDVLLQHTEEVISAWTPEGMPHPLRYTAFVGLADAAVVNQEKISSEVPPWVPCTTVMPPADLEMFSPRPADTTLRERHGLAPSDRVIVYPGGLNDFTRPGLRALCEAVGLVNRAGVPCKLLRTGPVALDFLEQLELDVRAAVRDLGPVPRAELPGLMSLSDVFVQPGKHDAFEDLRLPGKLPEFFAMGRPVVLPDTNIAPLLEDGVNAVIHRTGSPQEIAGKCLELFRDRDRAARIGAAGRRFAEEHFDAARQAAKLEAAYVQAHAVFSSGVGARVWTADAPSLPAALLLARKLRAMASDPQRADGRYLTAYAELTEFMNDRCSGLETGIAVRDAELHDLRHHAELRMKVAELTRALEERDARIAALKSSFSWRLTAPARFAVELAARLRGRA